jgi:L-fuconolactonase
MSGTFAKCIDSHHHLWRYAPPGPSWLREGMESLRRDFLLDHLKSATIGSGVTESIVVEVERTLEETAWLTSLANQNSLIGGVVGWAPLTDPSVEREIEKLASLPKLKGIRFPIHDEPDNLFVLRKDFNRGISSMKQFDLKFDLLIFEHHLPQTCEFVDMHPGQIFILDHIGKPRIRDRELSPWRENISELAKRKNVFCKLSGLVTEADWADWDDQVLAPYFDTVLEAFGPHRLMFGSDWPLVTLASTYERWMDSVRLAVGRLSETEQESIFWKTAVEAYGLENSQGIPI